MAIFRGIDGSELDRLGKAIPDSLLILCREAHRIKMSKGRGLTPDERRKLRIQAEDRLYE